MELVYLLTPELRETGGSRGSAGREAADGNSARLLLRHPVQGEIRGDAREMRQITGKREGS